MQNFKSRDFWIHVLLFICIAALVGGYFFILSEVSKLKNVQVPEVSTQSIPFPTTVNCDADCRAQIEADLRRTAQSSAGPTPSPTTVIIQQNVPATGQKTTYIPLSGPFSTTNTAWTDTNGAQAYIDLKNNYSVNAYVTWQASMKAVSGGEIHARLFDSTHGIAVDNSEISTASTSATLVSSGKLNLWSGNNLYKVQVKSLNSFNVTFDSGSIKIVY